MAKHDVNITIKARDQASKIMGKTVKSTDRLTSALKRAAVAAGAYFGARAIKNFVAKSLELYGIQEAAVNDLSAALGLLGKNSAETMSDMKKFASGIQKVTIYGDEAVLGLMSLGASMGKLSGEQLKDTTKAALGLNKAFDMKDPVAAMRLLARAAQGDTGSLSRYGIKVDATLSKQEKFNAVLAIGANAFKLAEAETNTYVGAMKQMSDALGDVKEKVGEALAPVFVDLSKTIKTWAEDSQSNIYTWAESTVKALARVGDGIYGVKTAWEGLLTAQLKTEKATAGWFKKLQDLVEVGVDWALGTEPPPEINTWVDKWKKSITSIVSGQEKKFSEALFDTQLPSEKIAALFAKSKFKASDFGAGAGAGAGDGAGDGAGAKAARDVQQRLQFREARQLTFAPGARMDPAAETAKNTAKMTKLLEFIAKEQPKFSDLMNAIMPGQTGAGTVLVSNMQ